MYDRVLIKRLPISVVWQRASVAARGGRGLRLQHPLIIVSFKFYLLSRVIPTEFS